MTLNIEPKSAMLNKESLRRKNFKPEVFFASSTAKKLKISNETDSQSILVCLMKTGDKLQEIRDKIGVGITPSNIYRCHLLNDAVGGSKNSWHIQGLAADINATGYTPLELQEWLRTSEISLDKCLLERGCVHVQFNLDDSKNRNFFDGAVKIDGEWVLTSTLKKA